MSYTIFWSNLQSTITAIIPAITPAATPSARMTMVGPALLADTVVNAPIDVFAIVDVDVDTDVADPVGEVDVVMVAAALVIGVVEVALTIGGLEVVGTTTESVDVEVMIGVETDVVEVTIPESVGVVAVSVVSVTVPVVLELFEKGQ